MTIHVALGLHIIDVVLVQTGKVEDAVVQNADDVLVTDAEAGEKRSVFHESKGNQGNSFKEGLIKKKRERART